ncbi:MAG: matrixin family metalloprotease [Phycisphaerales bacterium JB059]
MPAPILTTTLIAVTGAVHAEAPPQNPDQANRWGLCDMEGFIGGVQLRGGGMAGSGWDGSGANATTVYFRIENSTSDLGAGQRAAILAGLQIWADIVQIDFVEIGVANANRSIDFRFVTGNHCSQEPDECGDADCAFDGPNGVLAHAGFPPGVNSACVDPMEETWAGNVHFDDDEPWEQDDAGPGFSMALIAAHEVGHAIGLTHDTGGGGPHIMRPLFSDTDGLQAPSASDTLHLWSGYAAGTGAVVTLEEGGLWVNGNWTLTELGLPGAPFNTIVEAENAIPPFADVDINVSAGSYPQSVTFNRPCTINAIGGTVVIGQ